MRRQNATWWFLTYGVLIAGSIVMLVPLAWMLLTSLKSFDEVIASPPVWLPRRPLWGNYREALTTFEEALAVEEERRETGARIDRMKYSYVDRGRYLDQILSLVEGHGRDNVHVMLLEDLTQARVPTLRELLTFLDVDPAPAESVPERWTNRYRVATDDGRTQALAYPPMDPATRERLVEEFREPNDRLAAWLGRDLSAWNKA